MATRKKNVKDHRARRNMGSAEFYRKQRHERNAARENQSITVLPDGKIVRVRD